MCAPLQAALSEGHKSDLFAEIKTVPTTVTARALFAVSGTTVYSGFDIEAVRITSHNWKSTAGLEDRGYRARTVSGFAAGAAGMTPKEITGNVWG